MLSIRLQRLGRRGHPVYRVVVQDSRQSPHSGKFIALLGSYDPHTKTSNIDKDKAAHYLKHGAQPSDRVVKLFSDEKITLPKWVKKPAKQKRQIRNPEKLRKNRPAGAPAPEKPAPEEKTEAEQAPDENTEAGENTEAKAQTETETGKEPNQEDKQAEEQKPKSENDDKEAPTENSETEESSAENKA